MGGTSHSFLLVVRDRALVALVHQDLFTGMNVRDLNLALRCTRCFGVVTVTRRGAGSSEGSIEESKQAWMEFAVYLSSSLDNTTHPEIQSYPIADSNYGTFSGWVTYHQ